MEDAGLISTCFVGKKAKEEREHFQNPFREGTAKNTEINYDSDLKNI